jgi:uncharacterized protein YjiK
MNIIAFAAMPSCNVSGMRNADPIDQAAHAQETRHLTAKESILKEKTGRETFLGYRLDQPDDTIILPPELSEISGITDLSDHEIGCVQDEDGIIFTLDLRSRSITRRLRFAGPGDYEGLTFVNPKLFVLRSDGRLYEVEVSADAPRIKTYTLNLPTKNNEGLGFDSKHRRLLIAPKEKAGKGSELKDTRWVFGFDLVQMKSVREPLMKIELSALRQYAQMHEKKLPERATKRGAPRPALRFLPSSIAVHPKSNMVFLLSAIDHSLVVLDRDGNIAGYTMLDPALFRQPEGMTFLSDGTLLIANEAASAKATLLQFRWQEPS